MEQIYIKNRERNQIQYIDGANFPEGKRKCTNCGSNMEMKPLGQPYVVVKNGKILVDVCPKTGKLLLHEGETDSIWTCSSQNCNNAVTNYRKKSTKKGL